MKNLRVGGKTLRFEEAKSIVSNYVTNKNSLTAYPAYDAYPGTPGPAVGEADLLAITLLNAGQKLIPSYYALERILPEINRRLSDRRLTGSLQDASEETLDAIAELYGVLDAHETPHVRLVKLSKVLHRKRPDLLPLFDKQVMSCYFKLGEPRVPIVKGRSWTDMTRAWIAEVKVDLSTQIVEWERLASLASSPPITPLRALDIVAWRVGSKGPAAA
ncbi:DUF6308 family protein [Brachybacterium paraconglomeratum]|uniref:DUF6308 family protein n=1 Tax=Brachybacterium paraconglomeratum TaxID=173362 RepID=UPI003FD00600